LDVVVLQGLWPADGYLKVFCVVLVSMIPKKTVDFLFFSATKSQIQRPNIVHCGTNEALKSAQSLQILTEALVV
jgi:hypothetical protein